MEALTFIPEVAIENEPDKPMRLAPGLFLLPKNDERARGLCIFLDSKGFKLESGGIFLYFKGDVSADGTIYEIFQGYAYALTFYYEGRATCRVVQQIQGQMFKGDKKRIEEGHSFEINFRIRNHDQAVERWEKMINLNTPKEEKEQIAKDLLEYCKLDTMAMVENYKKLLSI